MHGYPRPQLVRNEWICLDGDWDFALDPEATGKMPNHPSWHGRIRVPFSPETPASGVGRQDFYRACWYGRQFQAPALNPGDRLLLHFGAVDYSARVWVNGRIAAENEGGYTPFYADITDSLNAEGPQTIVVRAEDDPADLSKPRGKQDWQLHPHSIWYPRTTGIWQTVWMERVPATYISALRWTPNLERWEIGFEAWTQGQPREELRCTVKLTAAGKLLAL